MKEEYKSLKQKLISVVGKPNLLGGDEPNIAITSHQNDNMEEFIEKPIDRKAGCLVKLIGLDKAIVKQDILVALRHFCNPAYIDYKKGSEVCVVRFDSKTLRDAFAEKCLINAFKIAKNIVILYVIIIKIMNI